MPASFTPVASLAAGVVAGLAIAVPLGAVGVLLLQEGMRRGRRVGAGGAVGVASVDLMYAAVAVSAGAAVSSLLAGRDRPVRIVAGLVLAAVAVHGLWGLRRGTGGTEPHDAASGPAGGFGRSWARFVAITAVNPMTCLYFVTVAAGWGSRFDGPLPRVAFVVGVGVGSVAWQLALVLVGAGAGRLLGARGRMLTALVGNVVVLALAGAVLIA